MVSTMVLNGRVNVVRTSRAGYTMNRIAMARLKKVNRLMFTSNWMLPCECVYVCGDEGYVHLLTN